MYNYESVTIFICASTETDLLEETIKETIDSCSQDELSRIIVVVPSVDSPSYKKCKEILERDNYEKVSLYIQKSTGLALCLAELPSLVTGSHFIFMAADMEMDPHSIRLFIEKARRHPHRIIAASKWMNGSTVTGYGKIRSICSRTQNFVARQIIHSKATDLFSFYQIYPLSVYREMNFQNPSMFVFEYTLRPICLGVEYEEIPTVYRKRKQGKTHFTLFDQFRHSFLFISSAIRMRRMQMRKNNVH